MKELIPQEIIENKIFLLRGKKVMLDKDMASLYEVTTGNLIKYVLKLMTILHPIWINRNKTLYTC